MTSLLQHHLASSAQNEELTAKYLSLAQLYEQKHWHELTTALEELVNDEPRYFTERNMLDLYFDFVQKFEQRLNPVRLATFCAKASKQFFTNASNDKGEEEFAAAREFMEQIGAKVSKQQQGGGLEAGLVCQMRVCSLYVQEGKLAQAQQVLTQVDAATGKLAQLEGSVFEPQVKASYYLAQSQLLRQTGPAGEYFRAMLGYFAQKQPLPAAANERLALAVDVAVAALVAENVFNFGEILQYAIIKDELQSRPTHAWLYELLVVFNEGDVDRFMRELDTNRQAVLQSPTLAASLPLLREKVTLLALVCQVFERPNQERDLTFDEIAQHTRTPLDQVEWLVMQAFSKSLLRGFIDGVQGVVHFSWIMPRVLDAEQIKLLGDKLEAWSLNVDTALTYETIAPELFAS